MNLEVRLGDQLKPVGVAEDSPEKRADIKGALCTLAELTAAGLFSLRADAVWEFRIQFQFPEDWQEFVNHPDYGGIAADQESLDAALSRPDGHVLLTEENRAAVYARK